MEKKAGNWEKCVSCHVNYHIIPENIKEYGCQGLDPGTTFLHLMNDMRCNKRSTVIVTARSHPDKCEKDFNAVVTYLLQCIEKGRPIPSIMVVSITQTRPVERQKIREANDTFKGQNDVKEYSRSGYTLGKNR